MPKSFNIIILVSGNGSNLQAIIDAISNRTLSNVNIRGVISDRPEVYALTRSKINNIRNTAIDRKFYKENLSGKIRDQIKIWEKKEKFITDLIVLAGFLSILSQEFTETFKQKIINIHPALLPSFGGKGMYGINVHKSVIASGSKISGATVHLVNAGTDTGPILYQESVPVLPDDTPETLAKKVLLIEHKILPFTIKYFGYFVAHPGSPSLKSM